MVSTDAELTTERIAEGRAAEAERPRRRINLRALIVGIIVLDVLAFLFVPPFPHGEPGKPVTGIGDLILANLEFPAPPVVFPAGHPAPSSIISFDPSISAPIFTTWLVMLVVLVVAIASTRR